MARVAGEAEADVRVEADASAPAELLVGRKPSFSKTPHTWAHACLLLCWRPPPVQSSSPAIPFRNLSCVAAAYAMPAACSMAFPWPTSLLGCWFNFPLYLGNSCSHSVHFLLLRSSLTVPLCISRRAPSRRQLKAKSWTTRCGKCPPLPLDFHMGQPAVVAQSSFASKSSKSIRRASSERPRPDSDEPQATCGGDRRGGGGGGGGGGGRRGDEDDSHIL